MVVTGGSHHAVNGLSTQLREDGPVPDALPSLRPLRRGQKTRGGAHDPRQHPEGSSARARRGQEEGAGGRVCGTPPHGCAISGTAQCCRAWGLSRLGRRTEAARTVPHSGVWGPKLHLFGKNLERAGRRHGHLPRVLGRTGCCHPLLANRPERGPGTPPPGRASWRLPCSPPSRCLSSPSSSRRSLLRAGSPDVPPPGPRSDTRSAKPPPAPSCSQRGPSQSTGTEFSFHRHSLPRSWSFSRFRKRIFCSHGRHLSL